MNLSGSQRQILHEALLSAYPNDAQLSKMVSFELDENLNRIAGTGTLDEVVFKLIEWAEAQDKLKELISGAINQNAGNPQLTDAARKFAGWLAENEKAADGGKAEDWIPRARPVRVFLCHASLDKPRMRQLYEYLERDGAEPWLDVKNLRGGQNWQVEIPKAVARSDVILVCFSTNASKSDGFIQEEMRFALDEAEKRPPEAITIIPIRLEDVDIPARFAQWHWVNLFDSEGYEELLSSLEMRAQQSGLQAPRLVSESFRVRALLDRIPWRMTGAAIIAMILVVIVLAVRPGFWEEGLGSISALLERRATETATPAPSATPPAEETDSQIAQVATTAVPTISTVTETSTPTPVAPSCSVGQTQAFTGEAFQITGSGEAGSGVEVISGNSIVDTVTVSDDGTWASGVTFGQPGIYYISARRADNANMLTVCSILTILVAPTPTPTITPTATSTVLPTATSTPTITDAPEPEAGAKRVGPNGAIYVYIPAGEYLRGSDDSDELASDREKPQRSIYISDFWIMQTEVTNAQYEQCYQQDGCTKPGNDRWNDPAYAKHPVVSINWEQATEYAEWVGGRLPTEAEWEKACRWEAEEQQARIYPWGDQIPSPERLNFFSDIGDTTEVGQYAAGANQLFDMAGNTWEWTADWYVGDYYRTSPDEDPPGPESGTRRVLRGGSFFNGYFNVRCAYRSDLEPTNRLNGVGFRVVSPG